MSDVPIPVFYSYAHEDEDLRSELSKQLRILERIGIISSWYDRDIGAGDDWKNNIDGALAMAKIILLLVSPDFIASDYCYDIEMAYALDRHNRGEAVVIPIFLRKTIFDLAPFANLQGLPTGARVVTDWPNRDDAFADIAAGVRRAAERIKSRNAGRGFSEENDREPDSKAVARDINRIAEYRQMFDRAAFSVPCIFEGSLIWLLRAIDQILDGFGTGRVLSRDRKLIYNVPRRTELETKQFIDSIDQVAKFMLFIKREVVELIEKIESETNNRIHHFHMEFILRSLIEAGVERSFVQNVFDSMDRIDSQRNAVSKILNALFEKVARPLPKITLSSALLKESAEMDNQGRTYDWDNFYLRCHKEISAFLSGA